MDTESVNRTVDELLKPLKFPSTQLLALNHFPTLMKFMSFSARRALCTEFARKFMEEKLYITTTEMASQMFELLTGLLADQDDQPALSDLDLEEFAQQQLLAGSLVHLLKSNDLATLSAIFVLTRRFFTSSGPTRALRVQYTLPCLVYSSLQLALKFPQVSNLPKQFI